MRLTEADGKALLRHHGIAVPRGAMWGAPDAPPAGMMKAQLLEGGRGKRGLIRRFAASDGAAVAALLPEPYAEEAVAFTREIYLALMMDGTAQSLVLLASPDGGMEVESAAAPIRLVLDADAPDAVERAYAALRGGFDTSLAARLARYALRLARVMRAEALDFLEINPLAVTADGTLVALDCKATRDDCAALPEPALSARLEDAALTPLEREARARGFAMVELPGTVALVTAGAGLGMLMVDLLGDAGAPAACFMDNIQGHAEDTTEARLDIAFRLAERPEVKAIAFHTTLASRPLKGRVEALAAMLERRPAPKPLVAGFAAAGAALMGFDADAARARLAALGVTLLDDPRAVARAAAAHTK